MSAKEIKERLKSARDLIKAKQFDEALKLCQEVLELSADNYVALVCLGAALEGLQKANEAFESYRKASKVDTKQSLAWQGICSVFEKCGETLKADKNELVQAYEQLIEIFQSDKRKSAELSIKLAQLYSDMRQLDKSLATCETVMKCDSWKDLEEEKTILIYSNLAYILPQLKDLTTAQQELLEKACLAVINSSNEELSTKKGSCWKSYIGSLVQRGCDVELIWSACEKSVAGTSDALYQYQLMSHIYLDCVIDKIWDISKIEPVITSLESLDSSNPWQSFVRGYRFLLEQKAMDAKPFLEKGLEEERSCIGVYLHYARCLNLLHSHQKAADMAEKGIKLIEAGERCFGERALLCGELKICRAEALVNGRTRKDWDMAIDICRQIGKGTARVTEANILLAKACIKLSQLNEAKEALESLEAGTESAETVFVRGLWYLAAEESNKASDRFVKVIAMKSDHSAAMFYLGLLTWKQLQTNENNDESALRESCFKCFIQAAKLDPYFCDTFIYLGHCYRVLSNDFEKARRCYQKAYDLDSDSEEAGSHLIDCLLTLQHEDQALSYLQSITKQCGVSRGKWAWLRLGLYHLKLGDANSAIAALQSALRQDSKDSRCWECLGEAYMNRGSYNAAVKAFNRATELDPTAVHSLYQLAVIKLKLTLYTEAIRQFNTILQIEEDYVPALKGCAEALIYLARSYVSLSLHALAQECCESAIDHLTRAARRRPDLVCIWKLLGDACTILHPLSADILKVCVPNQLLSQKTENDSAVSSEDTVATLNKKEVLSLGSRCYGMAVKLRPEFSPLWHDLGVNYYHQSCMEDNIMAKVIINKSLQTLKQAVSLSPSNHSHWSALGVVAASKDVADYALAQHCFIKSIKVEANNVVAWTNLGTLYLLNDKTKLAHEAFKVAQSLDPSYVNCWLGQAFIAEQVGDNDAMDLYRHAITEFSVHHMEALSGYPHHVCLTVLDNAKMSKGWYRYAVENLNAVCAASDAMSKYTDCLPNDANAWNTYALLLERQNLNILASKYLARACELVKKRSDDDALKLAINENCARLLVKTGRYSEAVSIYESQPALIIDASDPLCCYALALNQLEQLDASFKAYQKALAATTDEDFKAKIHVALGLTAYKLGNNTEALNCLFSSVKCASPPELGLCALLSLAVLQKDVKLITAVMKELQKHQLSHRASTKIVLLKSLVKFAQGLKKTAIAEFQKLIHHYPNTASHWILFAQFALRHTSELSASIRDCCLVSLRDHDHNLDEGYEYLCRALYTSKHQSSRDAFRAAQKAVYLAPDKLSNWCLLLATSHSENIERIIDDVSHLDLQAFILTHSMHLMSRVESELTHSTGNKNLLKQLHHWCARQYVLAQFVAERLDSAKAFLEQATWLYSSDTMFTALLAHLNKDSSLLNGLAQQRDDPLICLMLIQTCLTEGKTKEAHGYYSDWLKLTRLNRNQKVQRTLAHWLMNLHLSENNSAEIKEMLKLAKKEDDQRLIELYDKHKTV